MSATGVPLRERFRGSPDFVRECFLVWRALWSANRDIEDYRRAREPMPRSTFTGLEGADVHAVDRPVVVLRLDDLAGRCGWRGVSDDVVEALVELGLLEEVEHRPARFGPRFPAVRLTRVGASTKPHCPEQIARLAGLPGRVPVG